MRARAYSEKNYHQKVDNQRANRKDRLGERRDTFYPNIIRWFPQDTPFHVLPVLWLPHCIPQIVVHSGLHHRAAKESPTSSRD